MTGAAWRAGPPEKVKAFWISSFLPHVSGFRMYRVTGSDEGFERCRSGSSHHCFGGMRGSAEGMLLTAKILAAGYLISKGYAPYSTPGTNSGSTAAGPALTRARL